MDRSDKEDVAADCFLVASNYWKDLSQIFEEERREVPKFLKRDSSLVSALKYVGGNIGANAWLDIKGENLMQREDGTIVITDPYAGN